MYRHVDFWGLGRKWPMSLIDENESYTANRIQLCMLFLAVKNHCCCEICEDQCCLKNYDCNFNNAEKCVLFLLETEIGPY